MLHGCNTGTLPEFSACLVCPEDCGFTISHDCVSQFLKSYSVTNIVLVLFILRILNYTAWMVGFHDINSINKYKWTKMKLKYRNYVIEKNKIQLNIPYKKHS